MISLMPARAEVIAMATRHTPHTLRDGATGDDEDHQGIERGRGPARAIKPLHDRGWRGQNIESGEERRQGRQGVGAKD